MECPSLPHKKHNMQIVTLLLLLILQANARPITNSTTANTILDRLAEAFTDTRLWLKNGTAVFINNTELSLNFNGSASPYYPIVEDEENKETRFRNYRIVTCTPIAVERYVEVLRAELVAIKFREDLVNYILIFLGLFMVISMKKDWEILVVFLGMLLLIVVVYQTFFLNSFSVECTRSLRICAHSWRVYRTQFPV
jgi:hypothetical protein